MLDRLKKDSVQRNKSISLAKRTNAKWTSGGLMHRDNNFSKKGIDFRPATLVTVQKGLHIVKTDSLI